MSRKSRSSSEPDPPQISSQTTALSALRRLRTIERKKLTELERKAVGFEKLSDSALSEHRNSISESLDIAERRFTRLQELDEKIVSHPAQDKIDEEITSCDEFSTRFHKTIAILKRLSAESLPRPATPVSSETSPRTSVGTVAEPPPVPQPQPERPICMGSAFKLDISPETFDGDRLRYRAFITQFRNWVGKSLQATPIDRLAALRKHLKGEPKKLVESLELTDANYEVALKLLEDNFGRVNIERQRVMASLINLPRVKSPSDTVGLRQIINKIQAGMKTLDAIGTPLESYAFALESSLQAAFPSRLLFEFTEMNRLGAMATDKQPEDKQETVPPTVESVARDIRKLIAFVIRYASHREQQELLQASPAHGVAGEDGGRAAHRSHSTSSKPENSRPRRATMAAVTPSGRKVRPCLFCNTAEHSSARCPATLSIQQRREILSKQKRCGRCFCPQHASRSECKGPRVQCQTCSSKEHYSSMHPPSESTDSSTDTVAATTELAAQTVDRSGALVFMADAFVTHGSTKFPIRVFLDQGSTLSFIKPDLRSLLPNAKPLHKAKLNIQAFASHHEISATRFKISLMSRHDATRVDIFAYEHDFGLHSSANCPLAVSRAIKEFGRNHKLADPSLVNPKLAQPPSMLVGIDQFYKIAYIGHERRLIRDVVAKEGRFGWMFGGPVTSTISAVVANLQDVCCAAVMSDAARDVDRLWNLESIGVGDPETPSSTLTSEEEAAIRQFKDGLSYDGTQYTVAIPQRSTIANLPNNKQVAIHRLENKLKELQRDARKYSRYHSEIRKFVDEGHAVEVSDFKPLRAAEADHSYYMPHHAVVTKSGDVEKWRIVFDCSSSAPGAPSLNSQLLPGPNLNPDLVTLLLNFRLHRVALSADIQSAYLCISVRPKDSTYFRFLWRAPGEDRIRCYQMLKVTWGATPSGFLLAATLREHFRLKDSQDVHGFGDSLYYDDFLKSYPTEDEAIKFIDDLRHTLSLANMRLAKWKTNSPAVAQHLMLSGVDSPSLNLSVGNVLKVLGISWLPNKDVFCFTIQDRSATSRPERRLTKRVVLRVVASVFDPLGWLSPFIVRGKLIIRSLWQQDLEWDQLVPAAAAEEFMNWTAEFEKFRDFQLPRTYAATKKQASSYRLHVFGDASQTASACAAYVQYCYADGTSELALIMCKSRLAPRDSPTLPRLELLAALMATRLKKFLVERMQIAFERIFFYTDSMITYYWATSENPGSWKTFVANRVRELQADSNPKDWFFVPGDKNVVDLATRGTTAERLKSTATWWQGPQWLLLPEKQWPTSQPRVVTPSLSDVQQELRHTVVAVTPSPLPVDLDRFSSLGRAIRTIAYAMLFGIRARKLEPPRYVELQRLAEIQLIRWTQEHHFGEELRAVRAGDKVPSHSKISAFSLFMDEARLLRAKTRLDQGPIFSFDEKNPVVVPGESRLAVLLVLQAHRVNAHFGVQTILSQLRRRFWVTRARQITKSILKRCVTCRRRQASSTEQVEAPLPPERTTVIIPFANTGIDFAGPFHVRNRQETHKAYIAVFSCMATRALHLELVASQSTVQTHLAIRRFISLYPGCRTFVSDNGKSFVKAATDIKRLFNSVRDTSLRDLLTARRIDWQFNCPRAPWRGGVFERVIGTVKNALAKTLGRSLISYEEFRTILAELASIVNDRPLTYVSTDSDAPSVLTPAHFLRGGSQVSSLASTLPLDKLGPNGEVQAADLRAAHRLRTDYSKHLVVRWYREYLLQLRLVNETRGTQAQSIKKGSVCILKEDKEPRVKWELVRVEDCHPGRDGLIRTYTVRFSNGNLSRRAAQLLIPLEFSDDSE